MFIVMSELKDQDQTNRLTPRYPEEFVSVGNGHAAKKVQCFLRREQVKLSPVLHDQASLTALQSAP